MIPGKENISRAWIREKRDGPSTMRKKFGVSLNSLFFVCTTLEGISNIVHVLVCFLLVTRESRIIMRDRVHNNMVISKLRH